MNAIMIVTAMDGCRSHHSLVVLVNCCHILSCARVRGGAGAGWMGGGGGSYMHTRPLIGAICRSSLGGEAS